MNARFIKYIDTSFAQVVKVGGFVKIREINFDQSYSVVFSSNIFGIKIQKYRREFYVSLFKADAPDKEMDLFNLLDYLNPGTAPVANYFTKENDIEQSYNKQLFYVASVIYTNFRKIQEFFLSSDFESHYIALEKFMIAKYPELFKKK